MKELKETISKEPEEIQDLFKKIMNLYVGHGSQEETHAQKVNVIEDALTKAANSQTTTTELNP